MKSITFGICLALVIQLTVKSYGEDDKTNESRIQAGSIVLVGEESAELQVEAKAVAELKRGEVLQVSLVNGEWLFVWEKMGWIHQDDVWTAAQAEQIFSKKIEEEPTPRLYYNRGIARFVAQRYQEAIVDFTVALKFDEEEAEIYNSRGSAWHKLGDSERAIQDISKAIKLDNTEPMYWINRSNVWADQGQAKQSLEDAEKAVELDPKSAIAMNSRGVCWFEANELEKALADYSAALALSPHFATAYANRAAVFKRQEKFDEAKADYENALRFNPRSATAKNDYAWFLANCPNKEFRDTSKAVQLAEEACQLTARKDWNMLDTLAVAYAKNGKTEMALKTWQEAIEVTPEENAAELRQKMKQIDQK